MTARHTPGPWSIHGDRGHLIGAMDGKQMIAVMSEPHLVQRWARTNDEVEANARLIASAPDLLAACERMASAVSEESGRVSIGAAQDAARLARRALASAKGGA